MEKSEFIFDIAGFPNTGSLPQRFGDEDFHISHQSNLLRKNEEYYRQFFPNASLGLPYIYLPGEEALKDYKNRSFERAQELFNQTQ